MGFLAPGKFMQVGPHNHKCGPLQKKGAGGKRAEMMDRPPHRNIQMRGHFTCRLTPIERRTFSFFFLASTCCNESKFFPFKALLLYISFLTVLFDCIQFRCKIFHKKVFEFVKKKTCGTFR